MNLLLDTHIWLRWLSPDQPLSETLRTLIEEADQLAVSAVSCWEAAYLAKKGRIQLPQPITDWVQLATKGSGVEVVSISAEIAISSAGLPDIHRDPADRFIIATALKGGYKLITLDEQIWCYECAKDLLVGERT